jgi:hypothetical protein
MAPDHPTQTRSLRSSGSIRSRSAWEQAQASSPLDGLLKDNPTPCPHNDYWLIKSEARTIRRSRRFGKTTSPSGYGRLYRMLNVNWYLVIRIFV